jgi:hypothetical protein
MYGESIVIFFRKVGRWGRPPYAPKKLYIPLLFASGPVGRAAFKIDENLQLLGSEAGLQPTFSCYKWGFGEGRLD